MAATGLGTFIEWILMDIFFKFFIHLYAVQSSNLKCVILKSAGRWDTACLMSPHSPIFISHLMGLQNVPWQACEGRQGLITLVNSHKNGLLSRTDKRYGIELISPRVAVPIGFTDSLTILWSLSTQTETSSLAKSIWSSKILYCEQRRHRSWDNMNVYAKWSFLSFLVGSRSVPAEHGGCLWIDHVVILLI